MEVAEERLDILKNLHLLLQQLEANQYSFALWRSPGEAPYLMVDLNAHSGEYGKDLDTPIEQLGECFVVNRYADAHPVRQTIIQNDLLIALDKPITQATWNPKLSASTLDRFFTNLSKTTTKSTSIKSPVQDESGKDYIDAVNKALVGLREKTLEKVVLARKHEVALPDSFSALETFNRAKERYPNAFCYLMHTPSYGLWMGATPERLLKIEGQQTFTTEALAGTQILPEGASLSSVAWTQKEIEEQAMVSRYIIACFKKIRLREFEETGPKTVKAGNLAHLKTTFEVDMEATNSPLLGSTMQDLLHPTSAVCGFPREDANRFILAHEGFDRELFAGFLGPVNFRDKTQLFVNLRCMKIADGTATLFAGAGITEDSDASKEYEETKAKMRTLLSIL